MGSLCFFELKSPDKGAGTPLYRSKIVTRYQFFSGSKTTSLYSVIIKSFSQRSPGLSDGGLFRCQLYLKNFLNSPILTFLLIWISASHQSNSSTCFPVETRASRNNSFLHRQNFQNLGLCIVFCLL